MYDTIRTVIIAKGVEDSACDWLRQQGFQPPHLPSRHSSSRHLYGFDAQGRGYFRKRGADLLDDVRAMPDSIGLIGLAAANELTLAPLQWQVITELKDVRYVLAARPDKIEAVTHKQQRGEPLHIATSFSRAASRLLGDGAHIDIIQHGSIEATPWQYPHLDAIFELVQTGDTLRANNLQIIRDDFPPLQLLLVQATNSPTEDVV